MSIGTRSGLYRALLGLLLVPAAFLSACGDRVEPSRPPHVVVFFADDLGHNDVGYQGGAIDTPRIDALAAGGVRFTQFYAQQLCSPSRGALLTGRYPFRMGLQEGVVSPYDEHGIPGRERTLAEALGERGYHCAIVGKWHLGRHAREHLPGHHGFDHQYGCYTGGVDYYAHANSWLGGHDWFRNGEPVSEEGYATDLLATEAVRVIEVHDPTKPLFLYLPFTAPHVPLQLPPGDDTLYPDTMPEKRRVYCSMVKRMDDAIGKVLDALRARGIFDDTLIFFASDNGGVIGTTDNAPFRGGKGGFYEGGLRVPALMHWQGHIEPGTVVDEPMHLVDIYPTLLRLTGAVHDDGLPLDGRDAWPVITEGETGLHDMIPLAIGNRHIEVIRQGDWKLLRPTRGDVELFNLRDDPGETKNLAAERGDVLEGILERARKLRPQAATAHPSTGRPAGFRVPATWAPSSDPHR